MKTPREIDVRENAVEQALAWALRNGYSYGDYALSEYCNNRDMSYKVDYQNCVTFNEQPDER